MRKRWLLPATLALAMIAALGVPMEAGAAFPGQNGKIAFSRGGENPSEQRCVLTANSNGTSEVVLLPPCDAENESKPRWSPTGTQLAYEGFGGQIDLVNSDNTNLREFFFDSGAGTTGFGWSPDGTEIAVAVYDCGEVVCESRIERVNATTGAYSTSLTTSDYVSDPDWSPNGQRIAFSKALQLYAMNPNGTGLTALAPGSPGDNQSPSWSPTGAKIAFVSNRDDENEEIYVMNADGTGQTRLTNDVAIDTSPRWSPDGKKILFESDRNENTEIYVMNADGTGQTRVTNNPAWDSTPDWQSIPVSTYVRPKGASPMRMALVPAFAQCTAPNRVHGAPLSSNSCNPPALRSTLLTTGGPEVNGKPVSASAFIRYVAITGDPGTPADEADVTIDVSLTDVLQQGTLADYTGQVQARNTIRITDKSNTPHPGGPGAGTVIEQVLRANVPCVATADPNTGATCSLSTTADAVSPGIVVEGRRSLWEMQPGQVDDPGPDGNINSLGDNVVFMKQGIFVP
jgi:TolB protein